MSESNRAIEALAEDYERQWQAGEEPTIDSFLLRVGDDQKPQLLQRLLPLEVRLRSPEDSHRVIDSIRSKYPQFGDVFDTVKASLGAPAPEEAATLAPGVPTEDATLPPATTPSEEQTLAPNITPAITSKPSTDPLDEPTLHPSPGDNADPGAGYFGEYELLEEIARGGMGVVFKARQVKLNRTVALKMILSGQLAGPEEVQRFYVEAEAAANLNHPGIVPIYEIGEYSGQHYFSMGFIEGTSVADRVKAGPLAPREAATIALETATAIAYAHEHGVIHRDLKPANVLLDRDGTAKVTDFGLAKKTGDDSHLTGTGEVLGTPSYMAPEQAAGKTDEIGPAADVYSLGAILYCLIVGHPPFQAASVMDTLMQVLEKEPPPPRQLDPSLPQDLETICLKCLEKDPRHRYESAKEVSDELQRFLNDEPILALPISPAQRLWKLCRRKPAISGLVATVAVLLLTLAIGGPIVAMNQASLRGRAEKNEKAAAEANDRLTTTNADLVEVTERERAAAEQLADEKTQAVANLYATSIRLAQQEWTAGKLSRVEQLLNETPADLRDWEWNYLQNLAHSEEVNLRGHSASIYNVGFLGDGKHVVSSSHDKTVRRWNINSKREVQLRAVPTTEVRFGGDNQQIVYPVGRDLQVLNLVTGEVRRTVALPDEVHRLVEQVLSRDGSTLAFLGETDAGTRTYVIDVKTGTQRCVIEDATDVQSFRPALSPDGSRFAATTVPNVIGIWDTASGEQLHSLAGHLLSVTSVDFNSDNSQLASAGLDSSVRIWDLDSGATRHTLLGHRDWILRVRFSRDGNWVITAGKDRTARIWHAGSGLELVSLRGNTSYVMDAALSADNKRLATASNDEVIRVWDVERFTTFEASLPMQALSEMFAEIEVTPDQQAKMREGLQRMAFEHCSQDWQSRYGHAGPLTDVEFFADTGFFLTSGRDDHAMLWSTTETGPIREWEFAGRVRDVATAPDGMTFAAAVALADTESVFVCRRDSPEPVLKLKGPRDVCVRVAISPDGRYLAAGGESATNAATGAVEVKIWELDTGREIHTIRDGRGTIMGLAFSNDAGSILVSDARGLTARWAILPAGNPPIWAMGVNTTAIAFHPFENVYASTHVDGLIRIWDADTQERIGELEGAKTQLLNLAYSPDGKRLVSCGDDSIVSVWDPTSQRKLLELKGFTHAVFGVDFSQDGRYIAAAGYDGTVNVWDSGRALSVDEEEWPIVFEENFDGGELPEDWIPQTGNWYVTNGALVGQLELSPLPSQANISACMLHLMKRLPADVDVEFDFRSQQPTGFEVGFINQDDYGLVAEALSCENPFLLMKGALVWTHMGGANYQPHGVNRRYRLPVKQNVRLRLRRDGDQLSFFADGEEISSIRIQMRRIPNLMLQAIYGEPGSAVAIDNLRVRAPRSAQKMIEVEEFVGGLFTELMLPEDVLERLQTDETISAELREDAISVAEAHPLPPHRTIGDAARRLIDNPDRTEADLRRGVRLFQEAVRQAPENAYYHRKLGEAALATDDYATALGSIGEAARLRIAQRGIETPEQVAMMAVCYHELGREKEAAEYARRYDLCAGLEQWRKVFARQESLGLKWPQRIKEIPRAATTSPEAAAVAAVVIAAEEARLYTHKVDDFLALCAEDVSETIGRSVEPHPYDQTFSGPSFRSKQLMSLRRPPEPRSVQLQPRTLVVNVDNETAEVELVVAQERGTYLREYERRVTLVRVNGDWKIQKIRSWPTIYRGGVGAVARFDNAHYKALDAAVPENPQATVEDIGHLRAAGDWTRTLELTKQLNDSDPANVNGWVQRWACAEALGQVDDALNALARVIPRAGAHTIFVDEVAYLAAMSEKHDGHDGFVEYVTEIPLNQEFGWHTLLRVLRSYYDRRVALGRMAQADADSERRELLGSFAESRGVDADGVRRLQHWFDNEHTWTLFGSYPSGDQGEGFNKAYPPEKFDTLTSQEKAALRRKTRTVKARTGEFVDLWLEVTPSNHVVAYGVLEIDVPTEQSATVLLGSDDGVKLWLNEQLVHQELVFRAFTPARTKVPVWLQAGKNTLVVKVDQATGAWGFSCEVIDELGLPIL